jgi:hypothetical protein
LAFHGAIVHVAATMPGTGPSAASARFLATLWTQCATASPFLPGRVPPNTMATLIV